MQSTSSAPRTCHDPTSVVQMATLTAESVRRRLRAKGLVPQLVDDAAQDAALTVVERMAKTRLDPSQNFLAYLYRAGSLRAGIYLSQRLSVVSIPRNQYARGREFQRRAPLPAGLAAPDRADGRRASLDQARLRTGAEIRLRRVLEPHVSALSGRERLAVEMLLGWHGGERDAEEAAWLTSISQAVLAGAVRRLGNIVRKDPRAVAARRALKETTEDQ